MAVKDTFFYQKSNININGALLDLTNPIVMGIVNITPDSFYSGSRYQSDNEIITRINEILNQGGKIIDLGAYSSRPGAEDIDSKTEEARLRPVLASISKEFPHTIFSLDTFRADIARMAVEEYGVKIINDISAGSIDSNMFKTIARLNVPYILMHMRGIPANMQHNTQYNNVTKDVITELSVKFEQLKAMGVKDIIIDPGFGFSKNLEQNYQLLNKLHMFRIFEVPLLVGVSRKSMIYKLLNTTPDLALNGTSVLNTLALLNGAKILRIHDVREAVETIKIVSTFNQCNE